MTNEKQLIVEVKNVYGVQKIYPVCEQAKILAQLSGCKTLTNEAINLIKDLGYSFQVKTAAI